MKNSPDILIPSKIPRAQPIDVHKDTFGIAAVNQHEIELVDGLNTARQDFIATKASEIARAKKRPSGQRPILRKLGQLSGVVMTDQEAFFVDYAATQQQCPDTHTRINSDEAEKSKPRDAKAELDEVRQQIADLGKDEKTILGAYCRTAAPPIFKAAKSRAYKYGKWADWLGSNADDQQLLNFLQWHTDSLRKEELDPNTQARIENERSEYKAGVTRGLDEGWLQPDAKSAIHRVDGIRVYMGDVFNTTMLDWRGYHWPGTQEIVVEGPNSLTLKKEEGKNSFWPTKHEFNHAVLGSFDERWMDEALTEHIRLVMEIGDLEEMRPIMRNDVGSYEEERMLMAILLKKGLNEIPVSLATRAYSKQTSADAKIEFVAAINESWQYFVPDDGEKRDDPLVMVNQYILRLTIENRKELSARDAQKQALVTTYTDLLTQPEKIFEYLDRKPRKTLEPATGIEI